MLFARRQRGFRFPLRSANFARMLTVDWETRFRRIFDLAATNYRANVREPDALFSPDEVAFLAEIGHRPREVFDYVEDWCDLREPTPEIATRIAGIRRGYFLSEQGATLSERRTPVASFPARDAELGGFRWLPRIIAKARSKLRGELPDDLMYSCGGDRQFLRGVNLDPVEFLRAVWKADGDDAQILELVRESSGRHG